jgi:hypothetical protein
MMKCFIPEYENRIIRPIKNCLKMGGRKIRMSNSGVESDQSSLYTCMEIS